MKKIFLNSDWQDILKKDLKSEKFQKILDFLKNEKLKGKVIFPEEKNIFLALNLTPFKKVKVVILGQDPYHGKNEATGLSFSVNPSSKIPPSLKNIFKELKNDISYNSEIKPDLKLWAKNGVLLLNSFLTVERDKPLSHSNVGWEIITDEIIKKISKNKKNVVFILWGKFANKKKNLINEKKHMIISSSHPSPFSAKKSFFGSRPFSRTNKFLEEKKNNPIIW